MTKTKHGSVSTCCQEDAESHQGGVAKVQQRGNGIVDGQLGGIVEPTVEKHKDGAGAAQQE